MFEVHNLTARTDPWCGSFADREAALRARDQWARAWPTNRYVVRRPDGFRIA